MTRGSSDRPSQRAAIITGCSSGIGAAAARRLSRAGLAVYATARRVERLGDLAADGIDTLPLDVTDEDSMKAAVSYVVERHGAVSVLVNNAGHGVIGPVEDLPLELVRAQFETNLFGALRLIQLVLPGMRAQRWGRIINVSSVFGRLAPPGGSSYHSSKHALEGLSDSLRLEVAPFSVRTILVQPGPVRTRFGANITHVGTSGAYETFRQRLEHWYAGVFDPERPNLPGRLATTPENVADVIASAVRARRPRARYPVGVLAHGLLALRRTLPDSLLDSFLRRQFPVP